MLVVYASPSEPRDSYKIALGKGSPRVYVRVGDDWTEVKQGEFTVEQHEQSLRVAATDSGWDMDGKWIESWTFDLLRTGPDEAFVAYLRTVNNPYLPANLTWQTFSGFTAGTARRVNSSRYAIA